LSSDDDAFNFLRRHRDTLFPGTPVVFCGVNFLRGEDVGSLRLFTGVNEDADLRAGIDVALKLHPDTKQVVVINDTTTTGLKLHEMLISLLPHYEGKVTFLLLEDLEMGDILERVQGLSRGSTVFYTLFFRDRTGHFFEYDESISLITQRSTVPVYGTWDFSLGYGIVGGKLTRGFDQGKAAGGMALRILRGERLENVPVVWESPSSYMFDYQAMERFGLKTSDLPPDSIVINAPESFYAVNKAIVWAVLAGMAGLTVVIVVLLVNIQRRRIAEESLRRARDELEIRVVERTADLVKANQLLHDEIAERKRAEDEIKKLNREIVAFDQEIGTLMSERTMNLMALMVADKVRNPVTVIAGVCGRMFRKEEVPPHLRECLESVAEGARRLETIVNDFQALLKSKKPAFKYRDLNEIVRGLLPLMAREAESRSVRVVLNLSERPLKMNAEESLLRIAILHVVKNSIEAAPEGGEVKIATAGDGECILLGVSDNGVGIPKDDIGTIFDPFVMTRERTSGMGLPLVKQIVSEHMGDITVQSEAGRGTTFTMSFPSRWKEA
jgi:signal transduction histidine kinase